MRIKLTQQQNTNEYPPLGKVVEGENFVDAALAGEYIGKTVYLDRRHTQPMLCILEIFEELDVTGTLYPKPSKEEIKFYVFRIDNFNVIEKLAWRLKN